MKENQDERKKELQEIFTNFMPEVWTDRMRSLVTDLETCGQTPVDEWISAFKRLLKQWEAEYGDDGGNLSYVVISFLASGVVTGTYELQIAFFDSWIYAEENPYCFYWCPRFFYRYIEADMELFRKEAEKSLMRIKDDEIEEFKKRYIVCHEYLVMYYVADIMNKVFELPEWQRYKEKKIKILCGTYMEPMVELCASDE